MPTADYGARVAATLESIENDPDIHESNKTAIREFKRDLTLDGMSDAWLQKLTAHLKIIAQQLGQTRFEDVDEAGMKDLVEWLQQREKPNGDRVSEATVNAYKQVLKRFYRWLHDKPKGSHPEITAWINTGSHGGKDTLPSDLLTTEDIDALIDACRNNRDAALVSVLWESGARIGELIDLTVGDLEDNPNEKGLKLVIDGKTGPRRLRLIEAAPHINRWLSKHPDPADDNPLWCKLQIGSEDLSYHYIRQKLLVRAKKRAEIDKPVNPHHFRHSRATYLANKFTEAQLCEYFGWVQGSDVPAKYVHLSGRDMDHAIADLHGLEVEEDEEEAETIVECWRCEEINEPQARFCLRCGSPLDEHAQDEIEAAETQTVAGSDPSELELAQKALRENPEALEEFLAELLED